MTEITQIAQCAQCGRPISAEELRLAEQACPQCGAKARTIGLGVGESFGMHDSLKAKNRSGPGKKGIKQELTAGASLRGSKGDWVEREMLVDHANGRYYEHVVDPKAGEIVRHVDEPLRDHRDRGSAKPKKPPTQDR